MFVNKRKLRPSFIIPGFEGPIYCAITPWHRIEAEYRRVRGVRSREGLCTNVYTRAYGDKR
jgi:hypothetical protein